MKRKVLPWLFAFLTTALCLISFIRSASNSQYISDIKELDEITDRISSKMGNAMGYADILQLFVQFNDGKLSEENFNALTDMALQEHTCIESFQLAPDAVVTYCNPLEGNEAAIGHELLKDDARKEAVQEAIDSESAVVQGPVDTVQGGVRVFGRKAIRVDGEFWGLAVVSIDFEELMKECRLSEDTVDFDFVLASYDYQGELEYTWGDKEIMDSSSTSADVQLSHQRWVVYIRHPWTLRNFIQSHGIYMLVTSLFAGFAAYMLVAFYINKVNAAKMDQLTKVLNRQEFERLVRKKLQHRSSQLTALLVVKVDDCRDIKDIYGHLTGDDFMVRIAERICRAVRKGSLISRSDTDEYMIFLRHMKSKRQLFSDIQKIRVIAGEEVVLEENIVQPRIFVGYALAAEEGKSFEDLYLIANRRVYEDKVIRKESERVEQDADGFERRGE